MFNQLLKYRNWIIRLILIIRIRIKLCYKRKIENYYWTLYFKHVILIILRRIGSRLYIPNQLNNLFLYFRFILNYMVFIPYNVFKKNRYNEMVVGTVVLLGQFQNFHFVWSIDFRMEVVGFVSILMPFSRKLICETFCMFTNIICNGHFYGLWCLTERLGVVFYVYFWNFKIKNWIMSQSLFCLGKNKLLRQQLPTISNLK